MNGELFKRSLLYTYILGFFAHGFLLVNLSLSHDDVFDFFDTLPNHQHQIALGRVLEPFYREATGSALLMPWSLGIVAFFWLGIAVWNVCRLFELSGKTEVFLVAGIMTVNISVTAVAAAYTPWLAVDMLACCLAVTSVCCWRRYIACREVKQLLFATLTITSSLSLYQSYLAVTIVLMILLSIQNIIKKDGAVKVFREGMIGIGIIMAGGIIYYFWMKLVCALTATPLTEGVYDSVTNLWDNQEPIIKRLTACLKEEMTHFFAKDENIYPYPVLWTMNLLIIAVCLWFIFCLVRQEWGKLGKTEWLLLLALAAVLPFAAYLMRILNASAHDLMCYSVWLLYLLPLLLWKWTFGQGEKTVYGWSYGVPAALLFGIIFSYIQTDNAVYVKESAENRATMALMTEVLVQIDSTEGYEAGKTEVTFVGDISEVLEQFPAAERLNGISGCNWPTSISYGETYQAYFDYVMLRDVNVVLNSTLEEKPEVVQMPAYPQPGYVQKVDQTVIVKWN